MNEQTTVVTDSSVSASHWCHLKRISWTAILAGAFVGIGASFLLNLFCVGIGLSAFTATEDGVIGLAIGGFIGLVISAFISMFAAGWVAGFIARPISSHHHLGELYGFITWSVALVLTVLMAAHVGKFVSNFSDTLVVARPHVAAVVDVTTRDTAPIVSKSTATNPSTGEQTTHATVNAEKATNAVGTTAFATFFLFFIGAIASCFGGAIAMRCGKCRTEGGCCSTCHK